MSEREPSWWPPAVGDKLKRPEGGSEETVCHVVSVFEHAGKTHAAVAWYSKKKQRWFYDVIGETAAQLGAVKRSER